MENKKTPLPEHVISAMRRDDGYIIAEGTPKGMQYVVYVLTTDGYKSLCTVTPADMEQLYEEGVIQHVGDGKWKLTDKGKEKE